MRQVKVRSDGSSWRQGDIHPTTGLTFWSYRYLKKYPFIYPRWVTADHYNKLRASRSHSNRRYYRKTIDVRREEYRQYKENNRSRARALEKERYRNNRGLARAKNAIRRVRRRGNRTLSSPDSRFIKQFYITASRISKCVGFEFHVDHVVPLAKGGAHVESNLQVMPGGINRRKQARVDFVWTGWYK